MKIDQETITRLYELTCLVATEYTQAELDKIKQKISDVVTKNGGEVKEVEDWGKKEMAYTIRKEGKQYREARYLHFVFESDATQVTQTKEAMNITDEIIRYLLIKSEE